MADIMKCTKTGCNVWIAQRNEWGHGDAFEANGMLLLRLVSVSRERNFNQLHFTVHNYSPWFVEMRGDKEFHTIVCHEYMNHGYDGIRLAVEATPIKESFS